MKARIAGFAATAIFVGWFSVPHVIAQGKEKAGQPQKANVQGTIQNISKETSTFTVRTNGTATRLVVFNPKTRFLYGHSDNNKPGSVEQVKVSNYLSCAGTFDAKSQLMATDCVYRESK